MVSPVYRIPFSTTSSSCVEENLLADLENCFFAGPENYLLPSVVSRVSHPESDCGFLAPLVFWGGTGCGKSFLAHGLVKRCRDEGQDVILLTGEDVNYRRIVALQKATPLDALWVIDNFDRIPQSGSVAEILCQLIDQSLRGNFRVLFMLDRPPAEFVDLCPRLRGRLCGGLVLQLQELSMGSKVFILEQALSCLQITHTGPLKQKALKQFAAMDNNPREMVSRLLSQRFNDVGVSWDNVLDSQLQLQEEKNGGVPLRVLGRGVSEYFGITMRDLMGRSRRCGIVAARHMFMYLAHRTFGYTTQEVASFLHRDPSTILHGYAVIRKKIKLDPEIEKHVSLLKHSLQKQLGGSGIKC